MMVILSILLSMWCSLAQGVPPGVNAAAQSRFGVGALPLSMGSAFTALPGGALSVYWNPAYLAAASPAITGMYTEPFGGSLNYRIQFLALGGHYREFGFGVGWFNSHVGGIPYTEENTTFDYDSSIYYLSGALRLTDERLKGDFFVGVSAKLYRDAMLQGSAQGLGWDLGLALALGDLRLAYCGQDVGNTRYRWHGTGQEPLVIIPWIHRFGVAYSLLQGKVTLTGDLYLDRSSTLPFQGRFGGEYTLGEWLKIRAGVRLDPQGDRYHPVLTLGLGIGPWKGFSLDYAYLHNPLPASGISTDTHVFSVSIRF